MTKKEQILETILIGLCKITIFVIYPAIYYLVTKSKTEIYEVTK